MEIKGFKYLLFILIFLLVPNAYALDYNVSSIVSSPVGGANSGKYAGTELNGGRGAFSIGTRYNGILTRIEYNLPVPSAIDPDCWPTNMTYTITMNMATEDWRNRFGAVSVNDSLGHEFSNGNVSYISMKKIKFTFKIPSSDSTCHNYVYVNLPSRELFTPFTGETNWNLSSIIVSDTLSNGSSGGSSGGTSTPTPTPGATNQDIINNQNQNTQDIIDNQDNNTQSIIDSQNQNTSDIIENNNNNTEQLIESMKDNNYPSCQNGYRNFLVGSDKSYLQNNTGLVRSNSNYFITQPIRIKENQSYTLDLLDATGIQYGYYCFYKKDNTRVSCVKYSDNTTTSYTFTAPTNSYYVIFTLYRRNNVMLNATLKGTTCVSNEYESQITEFKQFLEQVSTNDILTDDSIDSGTGSDFFNDFNDSNPGGISSIVSKPLVLINNLLSNNNSCANLQLPSFLGVNNAYLPSGCILWDNASNTMITLWNTFVCGLGSYFILKDLFKTIEKLKNPDNDSVEVIDL